MSPMNRILSVAALASGLSAVSQLWVSIAVEVSKDFEIPLNLDMFLIVAQVAVVDPVFWGMTTREALFSFPAMFILAWLWEDRCK